MSPSLLSPDSAVKRHVLSGARGPLPFVTMSAKPPGEGSTFAERLTFAIEEEAHRTPTSTETGLMRRHPEVFKSRGFISSYTSGRRGASRSPDPRLVSLIAKYLHVEFEWLLLGMGPIRREGREETAAEQAMKFARTMGTREDAWEVAWERNKDREAEMSAKEWLDAIQLEAERLDRMKVPRPEAHLEARKIGRAKERVLRKRTEGTKDEAQVHEPSHLPRVARK